MLVCRAALAELKLVSRSKLEERLRELERDPERGKPLRGTLKGCRSIRIEGENRLVYVVRGDVVEVLAVGRRRDAEAYNTVLNRM